jgi:uracil-DNA glycosylase
MQKSITVEFSDEKYDWNSLTLWNYLLDGNYPRSWSEFFLRDDVQNDLRHISAEIEREVKAGSTVYPEINQVFRAFIPLDRIKAVILGQDPYHNGSAVGYCFSVRHGNKINPSLLSVYKELENEGYTPIRDGDIVHWAEQGCVLLNTALTVERGCAGEHIAMWYEFSEKVITYISDKVPDAVWLLMGSKALAFAENITSGNIIVTSHPMPLAAYKGFRGHDAFMGSGAFRKINEYLVEKKRKEIVW